MLSVSNSYVQFRGIEALRYYDSISNPKCKALRQSYKYWSFTEKEKIQYSFWKEDPPTHEVVTLDLWDALDYMIEHNLVADGPIIWQADVPHLMTRPAPKKKQND